MSLNSLYTIYFEVRIMDCELFTLDKVKNLIEL